MRWADTPCIGFDIESTGVDALNDRIVTMSLIDKTGSGRPKVHTWLVNPGVDIPAEATAVHGITTEQARAEGMDPGVALFEVVGRLARALGQGIPVVAFNAAYDATMLEAECARHDVDPLASRLDRVAPILDPMVLDRHADPYRKKACPCGCGAVDKTLAGTCLHYGVPLTAAHDATGDALAAVRLWPRILDRHPEKFDGASVGRLHDAQVRWRADQMASLRSYFDRCGIEHDGCCGEWPVHVRCLAESARAAA